jgi:hypothetical protein
MSSKPTKARKGSEAEEYALSPLNAEPLTPQETKRLNFLGYKANDIAELSPDEARYRIEHKKAKPGSKTYVKQMKNPLTGVTGSNPIEGHFDDETIERRNAGKDQPVRLIMDEWQGKGRRAGGLLFDQIDKKYRDAHPEYSFRWLSPEVVKILGDDGFQAVTGPDGGKVMCADSWLGFKPREIQEQEDREFSESVNAPFRDLGRPVNEAPTGNAQELSVFQESTVTRGDERPRHIPFG